MDSDLVLECIRCQLCAKIRLAKLLALESEYKGRKIIRTDIHIVISIEHISRVDHRYPNLERSPNERSNAK